MRPRPDRLDHRARVLIVDDEVSNRALLEVMLAPEGFDLQMASTGAEALTMVAERSPDLILLDVMMPGMDGYQVAAALKADRTTRNIPIIMVSALDDRDARLRGLGAGAEEFLTKPVSRAELTVRVRNLLRLKAYADNHDRYNQVLEEEVGSRTADLGESERLYRSTFDAAPVGIVHVGADGRWLRVNQRLCDMLGTSCEELQGPAWQALRHEEETPAEAEATSAMRSGLIDRHVFDEKRYRRKDGSTMWGRVNMSAHRDAAGHLQHLVLVIEDITERRALEMQLRQTNKMDAIGRLASGVAHDFNNLLTVILGFTEIIASDATLAARHGSDISEIEKAARSAAGLTKQLLAFSRQQILLAAPLDLNALIREMAGMLGRLIGENITITLDLAPRLAPAFADHGQLEQVVMNLVVNAKDAMPTGGKVTIATSEVTLEGSASEVAAVVPGRYLLLAISDTGTGMSAETKQHLFEPFYTTKGTGKGTGLGLSTTYGIVNQSKGYIRVDSEPGSGTTFRVYLPEAEHAVAAPAVARAVAGPGRSGSETLLLVEDESSVRRLTKRILEKAGYRVLEAANGEDAERVYAHDAETIALLVTDVIMPGCGGLELAARLQLRTPELRVLYLSGYTEDSVAQTVGLGRTSLFLQKPFTAEMLTRQVREALDRDVAALGELTP